MQTQAQATAQAAAVQAVKTAAEQITGLDMALGPDGNTGVFLYATPRTTAQVFAQALVQLQATDVEGLDQVSTADGSRDHEVTFNMQGQAMYLVTCYESEDRVVEPELE